MRDYLSIGSAPCNEDCAQVGSENYPSRAKEECKRFLDLIRKTLGDEPDGASLRIKSFSHDFGAYYEVVCYYDESEQAIDYAFNVENNAPTDWDDEPTEPTEPTGPKPGSIGEPVTGV